MKFTQILIYLNEEKYFQDFANLLISFGNEQTEEAALHRFLDNEDLWNLFNDHLRKNTKKGSEPISEIKLHFLFKIVNSRMETIITAPDDSNSWSSSILYNMITLKSLNSNTPNHQSKLLLHLAILRKLVALLHDILVFINRQILVPKRLSQEMIKDQLSLSLRPQNTRKREKNIMRS